MTRPILTLNRKPATQTEAVKTQPKQQPKAQPKKQAKPPKAPKAIILPELPKPDRSGEIIAALVALYPLAFTLPPQHPLEIGTIQQIPNMANYSRRELRDAVTGYCNDDAYLNCIINSTHRINVNGDLGSEVTQEHKDNALAMLEGRLKKIRVKQGKAKKKRKIATVAGA